MRELIVVTSIDTEEDQWVPQRHGMTFSNIRELPRLQTVLERLGARATYFVTYRVARDRPSAEIVRDLHLSGRAEIGAHLHPWNTPPMTEARVDRNTMLCNLAPRLQQQKIWTLTEQLDQILGGPPSTFRAGRYGFGAATVRALLHCGYTVDSSVTPFMSWQGFSDGPDFFGAPLHVYRLGAETTDVRIPSPNGMLLEVPESCGFTRRPFALWGRLERLLHKPALRRLHLLGLAARSGLVDRVQLSPETASLESMLRLSRHLYEGGERFVHWSWHSPSLVPGLSPFVRSAADLDRLYGTIQAYLDRLASIAPLRFATISEAAALLAPVGPLTSRVDVARRRVERTPKVAPVTH